MVANLRNVDEGLSPSALRAELALTCLRKAEARAKVLDLEPSPASSIQRNMKKTLQGRKVGILFADGSDGAEIEAVQKAVEKDGATAFLISPKVGGAKLRGGTILRADGQLAGSPSQLFDAVAVVLSDQGCQMLMNEAGAVQFVMEAFGHLKAIGASKAAKGLGCGHQVRPASKAF